MYFYFSLWPCKSCKMNGALARKIGENTSIYDRAAMLCNFLGDPGAEKPTFAQGYIIWILYHLFAVQFVQNLMPVLLTHSKHFTTETNIRRAGARCRRSPLILDQTIHWAHANGPTMERVRAKNELRDRQHYGHVRQHHNSTDMRRLVAKVFASLIVQNRA